MHAKLGVCVSETGGPGEILEGLLFKDMMVRGTDLPFQSPIFQIVSPVWTEPEISFVTVEPASTDTSSLATGNSS